MGHSFAIDLGMPPGQCLSAEIDALLRRAESGLKRDEAAASGFHDERRALKKLRALILLGRGTLPEGEVKAAFRDVGAAGRLLSSARDRAVMGEALGKLMRSQDEAITRELLPALVAGIAVADAGGRVAARRALKPAHRAIVALRFDELGVAQIAKGFGRAYRAARHAMLDVEDSTDPVTMHDWRKVAQRHWRHLQWLTPIWPQALGGAAGLAGVLSELLGDFQDLSTLIDRAAALSEGGNDAEAIQQLIGLARQRQSELREQAVDLGHILFAHPAKDVRRDLERAWRATQ